MRALAPTLTVLAVVLLAGCSRAAVPAEPGIAGRTAIVPEERSTCEALARADLAVVGTDTASRETSATALEDAGARAPDDVRPAVEELAEAYRSSAADASGDPRRSVVIAWFNTRCGGVR
ncbi:MAG TPA: hypothetical protein VF228_11630 [Iamia sp.]